MQYLFCLVHSSHKMGLAASPWVPEGCPRTHTINVYR